MGGALSRVFLNAAIGAGAFLGFGLMVPEHVLTKPFAVVAFAGAFAMAAAAEALKRYINGADKNLNEPCAEERICFPALAGIGSMVATMMVF
jgi:hypothetical protein